MSYISGKFSGSPQPFPVPGTPGRLPAEVRLQFPATLHTTYSRGELAPPPLGLPRDNLLLVLFDGERRDREVVKLLHLD